MSHNHKPVVVGIERPHYTDEEQRFTHATAGLYAEVVDHGLLLLPEGEHPINNDISVLFSAAQEGADSGKMRPRSVKKYIWPVAELWNSNGGRAPGSLGGFFGTTFSVIKKESGEYELSIGGVD